MSKSYRYYINWRVRTGSRGVSRSLAAGGITRMSVTAVILHFAALSHDHGISYVQYRKPPHDASKAWRHSFRLSIFRPAPLMPAEACPCRRK